MAGTTRAVLIAVGVLALAIGSFYNFGGRQSRQLAPAPSEDLPPLTRAELKGLFDYLDSQPCAHDLRAATRYLKDHNLPVDKTLAWLQENGAGCDCEVILNTDGVWGEWAGRKHISED
ncbi:MAG: DUF2695 domain-containing protein [Phycisphaerales bacterium]|nr:MAG: DUF2695 domain-containing protein [Phycisphaerales bacterium]